MGEPSRERLRTLCEQAIQEHDLAKLLELVAEIEGMLDEDEARTKPKKRGNSAPAGP